MSVLSVTDAQLTKGHRKRTAKIRAILHRDGPGCWYCTRELPEEEVTIEHLCPKAHGGPQHLSNLVLACGPCNKLAGDLSIAEKVELRETVRRFL